MFVEGRMHGAFLGMAVGDSLGAAVEFRAPGTFPEVVGYRDGGPHGLGPGEWTDDTSMALALADSIVSVGWDLNDQAQRYVDWRRDGKYSVNDRCFDIGITVSSALIKFEQTGDARTCAQTHDMSSGNGSIMRLAPIPIRYFELFPNNIAELSRFAEESSVPTHGSEQCKSACRYMTLICCGLFDGQPRDAVLSPDWEPLKQLREVKPLHPAVDEIANGSFREKQPPEICGSGYVVHSLEASLWAFHTADTFREAVLKAVNLGDDADTTGAVCGQIAGACWGRNGIPLEWREELVRREMIEDALRGLCSA